MNNIEKRFNAAKKKYDEYDDSYNDMLDNLNQALEDCDFDKVIQYAEKCKECNGWKGILRRQMEIIDPEQAKQISY